MPYDAQSAAAAHAAAASTGQLPTVLHENTTFFACSALGPTVCGCATNVHVCAGDPHGGLVHTLYDPGHTVDAKLTFWLQQNPPTIWLPVYGYGKALVHFVGVLGLVGTQKSKACLSPLPPTAHPGTAS